MPKSKKTASQWFQRFPAQSVNCSIRDSQGRIYFELSKVVAPTLWSKNAVEIAASKYFRRTKTNGGKNDLEKSIFQLVERIGMGFQRACLSTQAGQTISKPKDFVTSLMQLMIEQKAAFNSPVWFNCGLSDAYGLKSKSEHCAWNGKKKVIEKIGDAFLRPQSSACFIQSVDDSLESIFSLVQNEAKLFKYGSGSGTNFSKLRSKYDLLNAGGTSSGLISFLEVLDKSAGVIKSGGVTRRAAKMVCVDVDHPEILEFIDWKKNEELKAQVLIANGYSSAIDGEAYHTVSGQNANNSVRVTDAFMKAVIANKKWTLGKTKFSKREIPARELWLKLATSAHACADPGIQYHDTINKWHTCADTTKINASNPCSEYMFVDDSACNLASINLVRFLKDHDVEASTKKEKKGPQDFEKWDLFDWNEFSKVCEQIFLMQEILVDFSSYPTAQIARNSHDYRPLGLGFANLGGLLMRMGISYESELGRAWAGAIAAHMTGVAYLTSSQVAKKTGPFPAFKKNRNSMLKVMKKHRSSIRNLDQNVVPKKVIQSLIQVWNQVIENGERYGYRNAQATVVAPTGTIGLVMDCETTGIEPDYSLIKIKKLVGGGEMRTTNTAVRSALVQMKFSKPQQDEIIKYMEIHNSAVGAPHLNRDQVRVFATAVGENSISAMGHLKMMAAVQPFISGAISKTVNLPHSATVEEIADLYMQAWKMGLKSVAIYRDGSKFVQPLSAKTSAKTNMQLQPESPKCGECGFETILEAGCFKCLNCGSTTSCSG